jgi:hypothetical protein
MLRVLIKDTSNKVLCYETIPSGDVFLARKQADLYNSMAGIKTEIKYIADKDCG